MNDPVSTRLEAVHFFFVAAFSAVIGGLAGVIWAAIGITAMLTPKGGAVYLPNDEKFFLDNDLRFALVALLAGLVLAVVVVLVSRDAELGPGAVLGLAVGGVLGALVAAHVGHVIGHHSLVNKINHYVPTAKASRVESAVDSIDFKVRWWLGAAAWPLAAVGVVLGVLTLRGRPDQNTGIPGLPLPNNAGRVLSPPRTLGS